MLEIREYDSNGISFGFWDTETNDWVIHTSGIPYTRDTLLSAKGLLITLEREQLKDKVLVSKNLNFKG